MNYDKENKLNTLHFYFVSVEVVSKDKEREKEKSYSKSKTKPLVKPSSFKSYKYDYSGGKPKVVNNYKKENKYGPKKLWVPRKHIIFVTDILSSAVETPAMVLGLWLLTTYKEKKAFFPKTAT